MNYWCLLGAENYLVYRFNLGDSVTGRDEREYELVSIVEGAAQLPRALEKQA